MDIELNPTQSGELYARAVASGIFASAKSVKKIAFIGMKMPMAPDSTLLFVMVLDSSTTIINFAITSKIIL